MVGPLIVDQQTPLAMILLLPVLVIVAPLIAAILLIVEIEFVFKLGKKEATEPELAHIGIPPLIVKTWPSVPAARRTQVFPFQYKISPEFVPEGIPLEA